MQNQPKTSTTTNTIMQIKSILSIIFSAFALNVGIANAQGILSSACELCLDACNANPIRVDPDCIDACNRNLNCPSATTTTAAATPTNNRNDDDNRNNDNESNDG